MLTPVRDTRCVDRHDYVETMGLVSSASITRSQLGSVHLYGDRLPVHHLSLTPHPF